MVDYDKRMKDAWEQVPQHRQKEILHDLEHKAYKVDYSNNEPDRVISPSDDYNLAEPLADAIIGISKFMCNWIIEAAGGVGVIIREIKGGK